MRIGVILMNVSSHHLFPCSYVPLCSWKIKLVQLLLQWDSVRFPPNALTIRHALKYVYCFDMSLSIDETFNPFGGKSNNGLSNILNIDEVPDPDDEIVDICKTIYLSSEELGHYLLEHKNELTILSLNSVICLQESWLNERDDISPFLDFRIQFNPPRKICSQHGGLITYVNDRFSYRIKRMYKT